MSPTPPRNRDDAVPSADDQPKSAVREQDRHVEVLLRATEILECLRREKKELSLTDLSTLTGMQKSRILRLCGTLAFKGYLHRNAETLKYRLGPQLMALGRAYESANPLSDLSRPIIRRLAEEAQETASLFVVHGTRRLCLVKEDGNFPIRFVNVEGDVLDLHLGGGGKVLLSFLDADRRRDILQDLVADPENSLTRDNLEAYEAELRKIREQGYVISPRDLIPDVVAIAAPVFKYGGECCASIAVAGPANRLSRSRCAVVIDKLLEATAELSAQLGHTSRFNR